MKELCMTDQDNKEIIEILKRMLKNNLSDIQM